MADNSTNKTKKKTPVLWRLFATMFKIGLFTFGGGYAMIAIMENELVAKKHWIEHEEFLDMIAIAESTPGPVAINSATYIGYKQAGVAGAAISTLGVCLPSFLIIYCISLFFDAFMELRLVAAAFKGIQVCVVFLILSAALRLMKNVPKNLINLAVFSLVLAATLLSSLFSVSLSSIWLILGSGLLGIVTLWVAKKKGGSR